MKKRSLNKIKQIVSIGMSCIMAGSTCNLPMMLHAEEVQTENMQPAVSEFLVVWQTLPENMRLRDIVPT